MNTVHPIPRETVDGVVYLRPEGDLDRESLRTELTALFQQDQYWVILDCSKVDYLDAPCVHTLERFAKQFATHGGYLKLADLKSQLRALFHLLGCGALL